VIRLVLTRIAILVTVGLLCGTAGAVWLSKFVATLLYGVTPRDPTTLAAAVVTLSAVAGLASSVAALRATSTDPASVLRQG
jgi:putative ABC transport system permease protein